MNDTNHLLFSREHTWIRIEDNIGTVGITDFAQGELGEIVYADLPNTGSTFTKDEIFGSIEAVKTVSDLFMPISGKVTETNNLLSKEPTLVNSEPFENGWLIKIEILDSNELKDLLTADQYAQITNK